MKVPIGVKVPIWLPLAGDRSAAVLVAAWSEFGVRVDVAPTMAGPAVLAGAEPAGSGSAGGQPLSTPMRRRRSIAGQLLVHHARKIVGSRMIYTGANSVLVAASIQQTKSLFLA